MSDRVGGLLALTTCLAVVCLIGTSKARGEESPAKPAAERPADNWNDFLFVLCYGEIDPFTKPWDPNRYPAFMDAMKRMGANVSVPMVTWPKPDGWLNHPWTTAWLSTPGTVTCPWYLWIDIACRPEPNPHAPLGCYNNPEIKPHFLKILGQARDLYAARILRARGRPVLNFEKENAFTWKNPETHPMAQHYCKHCQTSFARWLKDWYQDKSPDEDTNKDGKTMNSECGTRFRTWDWRMWDKHGSVLAEEDFRAMAKDKYAYPVFHWLRNRWIEDTVWRDCYNDVARQLGIWQLCTQHMPARFLAEQPFVLDNGLTFCPSYTGDYWSRRDPSKVGIAYWNGLYQTNAVVGDPYYGDRYLARTCGLISRLRGLYWIDFSSESPVEYYSYQTSLVFFPKTIEALSWWAHTIRKQKWLFDQLLTAAPQVAIYPGEVATFPAFSAYGCLYGELAEAGFPTHYLDRDMILDGALKDYRALLLHGERIPREVLDKVTEFRQRGGYVCGFFNAGTWSLTKAEPEWFEMMFGARITRTVKTVRAIQREVEEPPFFTAREEQESKGAGYPFTYTPANPDSVLWAGVRSYWKAGFFRDDALVLARPTSGVPLVRITGMPADVSPADKSETCIILSPDSRGLFLGMHQRGNSTLRLKLITNFIESAGVRRVVECTGLFEDAYEGPLSLRTTEAYRLLSPDERTQLFILINNDINNPKQVAVNMPAAVENAPAIELRTIRPVKTENGRIILSIPPGQVRMVLAGPKDTVEAAASVQRVTTEEARVFPWHCSRHFFIRRQVTDPESWAAVYRELSVNATSLEASPNCIIVLGKNAKQADREFA